MKTTTARTSFLIGFRKWFTSFILLSHRNLPDHRLHQPVSLGTFCFL
jgi:hypothetical protein